MAAATSGSIMPQPEPHRARDDAAAGRAGGVPRRARRRLIKFLPFAFPPASDPPTALSPFSDTSDSNLAKSEIMGVVDCRETAYGAAAEQ